MGNAKNPKTPLSRPHTKPHLNKFKSNGPASGGGRGPKPPFKKPHGKGGGGGGGTFGKSKEALKQVNAIPFYSHKSFLIVPDIFPGKSSKIPRTSGGQSTKAEGAGRTTCQSQTREGGKDTTV